MPPSPAPTTVEPTYHPTDTPSAAPTQGPVKKGFVSLISFSIIIPLLSLSVYAWAYGKKHRFVCCTDIPSEIFVERKPSVAGDDATDIELVPVETFESWTADESSGDGDESSASYVRM